MKPSFRFEGRIRYDLANPGADSCADGQTRGTHCSGREDLSPVFRGEYNSRCGSCYLNAKHTIREHVRSLNVAGVGYLHQIPSADGAIYARVWLDMRSSRWIVETFDAETHERFDGVTGADDEATAIAAARRIVDGTPGQLASVRIA